MGNSKTWCKFLTGWRLWLTGTIVYVLLFTVVRVIVPPPPAVGMAGQRHIVADVRFFHDDSWIDLHGNRQLSQNIFDGLLGAIRSARKVIIVDMFLFNAWQGPAAELHRALSAELTETLIAQKKQYPELYVLVISDPINTVYGGMRSPHFDMLESAGIPVMQTDLVQLQDSNPLWSSLWRWLIRPLGNDAGSLLPNPFGEGRVSLRSYLALLNFKANHRKLLIADTGLGEFHGWVSSANPHDGSSAHRNVAIRFGGPAVMDLLEGERALLAMNGELAELQRLDRAVVGLYVKDQPVAALQSVATVQVLGESSIHTAVLAAIRRTEAQDSIDLAMFYLSERQIISALKAAASRGVDVRVLLDVNNDAFGRQKNGVPNRPVAAELVAAGVAVRWCATQGEQCHAKWLHVAQRETHEFILGSANYTRRNLLDLNMETNVSVVVPVNHPVAIEMDEFFSDQWNNRQDRTYSTAYEDFAQDSAWLTFQYRFMEMTGLSTF